MRVIAKGNSAEREVSCWNCKSDFAVSEEDIFVLYSTKAKRPVSVGRSEIVHSTTYGVECPVCKREVVTNYDERIVGYETDTPHAPKKRRGLRPKFKGVFTRFWREAKVRFCR